MVHEEILAEPAPGEVLVCNIYISLDPTHRSFSSLRSSNVAARPLGERPAAVHALCGHQHLHERLILSSQTVHLSTV